MSADHTELQAFFDGYARATVSGDTEHIAGAYAQSYTEATPTMVAVYEVNDDYRRQLRERSGAMAGLGLTKAKAEVTHVRPIGDMHSLADVTWTLTFQRDSQAPINSSFVQTYLIRRESGHYQILCYVSHEDQAAVMARDGITETDSTRN